MNKQVTNFRKTRYVDIYQDNNFIKVKCINNETAPGILVKLYCDQNSIITLNMNITPKLDSGNIIVSILTYTHETIKNITVNSDIFNYEFQNNENQQIYIGILFSECNIDDIFEVHKFEISSNKNFNIIEDFSEHGYTDKCSYFMNDKIEVFGKNLDDKKYDIGIYDINGNIVEIISRDIKTNNNINNISWDTGFDYDKSFDFILKKSLQSGIYLIDNKIPFIIKNTDIVEFTILYPINTIHAYNTSGGKSLYYSFLTNPKSVKEKATSVSIHRPISGANNSINRCCSEFLKWIYNNKYTHNIITDIDLDMGEKINSNVLIIIGHSEYWTQNSRDILQNYINSGNHVINFSGNTLWWKVSYNKERTIINCDKSGTDTINFHILKMPTFNILGVDYLTGGYGILSQSGKSSSGCYTIIDEKSLLFKHTKLKNGDTIDVPTVEFDGIYCDENGILSNVYSIFKKTKLCAIGECVNCNKQKKNTGIICIKKNNDTGIVVNCCSMDWCGKAFKNKYIEQITKNILDIFLNQNPEEHIFD
jgi:hypothetical protein